MESKTYGVKKNHQRKLDSRHMILAAHVKKLKIFNRLWVECDWPTPKYSVLLVFIS